MLARLVALNIKFLTIDKDVNVNGVNCNYYYAQLQ